MKNIILLVLASSAVGQTIAPVTPVAYSQLPSTFVGGGLWWDRGSSYPYQSAITYARNFTTTDPATSSKIASNWYLYGVATTPIAPTPTGGSPQPSTLSAGACYAAAKSLSGSVILILCGTGGLSATQASAGGQFAGNIGVLIRIKKSHWYATVGIGGSTLVGGATSGGFVAQPAAGILYGIGGN